MVGPRGLDVLYGSVTVDQLVVYDKKASWFQKLRLVAELRSHKYDLVVDLRNTLFPILVGAPYFSSFNRLNLNKISSKRDQHLAVLSTVAGSLNIDMELSKDFEFYAGDEVAAVKTILSNKGAEGKELIVMAPGAQSLLKRWYAKGFAGVADRLMAENENRQVVLVGAEGDRPVIEEVKQAAQSRLVDLCGQTSFRQLAALYSLSALVVSNDSAPLQLAYAMKSPAVAIFGPTNDVRFGRRNVISRIVRKQMDCAPCEAAQCHIEQTKACLLGIDPSEVFKECLELLKQRTQACA